MKISVIIPVYNVERYLARCLDSVLAAVKEYQESIVQPSTSNLQPCVEIICVNDGSTDGSAEILERYRSTFNLQPSTFNLRTQPNGGLGSARNAGLDAMTGDYVTFVDSDDWIPPHALATFAAVAEASKARLVVSMAFSKDTERREARNARGGVSWRMRPSPWIAGKKVQYSACNKLYAAELLRGRRFGATLYEDFPFTTGVFADAGEFAAVDAPLYVYCRNAGADSIVRSAFTRRKLDSSLAVVRQVLEGRRGRDAAAQRFLLRQAADGHSSTVGQVFKSGDPELVSAFCAGHAALVGEWPELRAALSPKARFRLWRMEARKGKSGEAKPAGPADGCVKELEDLLSGHLGGQRVTLALNEVQGIGGQAFRGTLGDGRRIFVKLGPQECIDRSQRVHRACRGLPFVPGLLIDEMLRFGERYVLCTEFKAGRVIRNFEDLTEGQVVSLVRSYVAFSERIQGLREQARWDNLSGDPAVALAQLRAYVRKHPEAREPLGELLALDPVRWRPDEARLRVVHNDFNVSNYAFEGDDLSVIYDYDILSRGLACEDLALVVSIRSRESGLSPFRRHRLARRFRLMVRESPWTPDEWRASLNEQRLRWAKFLLDRKPNDRKIARRIGRRDRRMGILLSVLGDLEREGERT